jgi:PPP family 3-phenylpropionic acid transporter
MIEVVYFFLFQSVAINMAYMPAHMRALGLAGRQISMVSAVAPMLSLVVPLGWAWLADRMHRHDRVLRIVSAGACLGFLPVVFARGFSAVLGGYLGYALFFVGAGGLADALAVARLRSGAVYGRLRLWGSLGYVLACLAGGALLANGGTNHLAGRLAPLLMWLALAATFLASLGIRGSGEDAVRPRAADVRALLGERRLRLLLLAGALHWVCMAPYNVYFGIFLSELGLPPIAWGAGLSVGVLAEMLVLLWFHRLEARFPLHQLLAAAFLASSLRWLAVAVVRAPAALILLQSLHGMTFGLFWSAAIALVGASVPAPVRATGQALLVVAINVGGAIGYSLTGRLYDASGPRALFLMAAIGELAPLLVVLRAGRRLGGRPATDQPAS